MRKVGIIIILFVVFSITSLNVNATSFMNNNSNFNDSNVVVTFIDNEVVEDNTMVSEDDIFDSFNESIDCKTIFGDVENEESLAWLIDTLYNYILILSPIILVIFTGIDLAKIIVFGDDDMSKKLNKRIITRFIILVCIFIIPTLVAFALDLFGFTGCMDTFGLL